MSRHPEIVIVAAVGAESRLIGNGLELPWHIPEDLKHFKSLTLGHPILMGRKTFDSLLHQLGGPLPGRRHLVVTRSPDYSSPHADVFLTVDDALAAVQDVDTLFITGGASMYAHFLETADRMELTLVDGDYEGDVFFPEYEHLVGTRYRVANEIQREGYRFATFVAD